MSSVPDRKGQQLPGDDNSELDNHWQRAGEDLQSLSTDAVGLPLLVTVEEAAGLLRLGRTRAYELVLGGRIRSVKVGRRRLVVRSSLEDFVNQLVAEQSWT
ncbi:MAG TPA: helix-turn-helix domain-containing protein [Acidimicrobiales bacterium]